MSMLAMFFSFLGNKGDEGIDGKGECYELVIIYNGDVDNEAMVIILMMITTLVMFR